MIYDYIIKNGIVIDPLRNMHHKDDVYILNGKIMDAPLEQYKASREINADGCYVLPGLIDNHTHLFSGGSDAGYDPDLFLLPNGVTSAIDQGTTGVSNFNVFRSDIIQRSKVDIKAYLNISSIGLPTEKYIETINPTYFERERIKEYFRRYRDVLIGLKIRLEKDSCGDMGLFPLDETISLANEIGCPVSVHVKNPSIPIPEIIKKLRKGDTWVHMYQQKGSTIIDPFGNVYQELLDAQKRGVYFDVASGRSSFSIKMIRRAFQQNFYPDVLGTDLVSFNMYQKPIFSLLYTMSFYLALGLSLDDVVKKCTVMPARIMHASDKVGALRSGFQADITIINIKKGLIEFKDCYGDSIIGNELLIPQCTFKKGEIVHRNIEF